MNSTPRALWGWSPPSLPANTKLDRLVDRFLPRTGLRLVLCYAIVIAVLVAAPHLPLRAELAADGLAALIAGSWCVLNFWRCRHAHCLVSGAGWLALAGFSLVEAELGRSMIHGDEQLVFLAVLVAALIFEGAWCLVRSTNAIAGVACQGD
jgi:hypothetical protein